MTHTSIDLPKSPSIRRFRRGIFATVAVLAFLCAGLVALTSAQGPKLSSAAVDTAQVVRQADQQLRLFTNQNLARVTASDVTISPTAPFTVRSQGHIIAVQFAHRLDYGTRYTVRVSNVTSQYQDVRSTLDYSFSTATASVYYLSRADPATGGATDSIIRTSVHGTDHTVVYTARHIQSFTVFPALLAVVSLGDDHTDSLSLVSLANSAHIEQLVLPGSGTITKLQSEPDVGVLGFVFTSSGGSAPEYSSDLMTVDLTALHTVNPVLGLNGKPLSVLDWLFLNGTTSVVAQANDQSVLLIDPKKPSSSTPLGVYAALEGSSPDGKDVIVADVFSRILLTISTGKTVRLETHQVDGAKTFGGALQLVGSGSGSGSASVQQVAVVDGGTGLYATYLIYQSGDTTRILFGSKDYTGSINGFSVSPNGQYVAVNVVPDYATSVSDGYFIDPRATSITTVFIDIASGAIVRSVAGFDESW